MKAKELRQRAWNALKGRYWWSVLAALIASLFGAISIGATSASSTHGQDVIENGGNVMQNASTQVQQTVDKLPADGRVAVFLILLAIFIVSLVMSIIGSSIKLGYCRYNMDLFTDVEKPSMQLLFSRTGIIWKAFALDVLESLIILAGLMLFIVPGIIFGLALSQCDFILGENPDMKVGDVIKKSWSMMKGNKWSLFCLGLSFIGWAILASIVPAGALLLAPYVHAADAAFYLDRTGRLSDGAKDLGEMEAKG